MGVMKYFIYILLLFYTIHLQSQSIETRDDLKVGVVLSGGGAKGLAHIGALKVIEEAGIQVDFIGGTSMGAIVGGLYASGYSASDLEKILPSLGLEGFMKDGISRKVKPFNQREAEDKYALRLPIVDNNLLIPRGINKGHAVLNKISQYTQHVNDIKDFCELPIPFLCIATDLEKGEQVILDKGYLPNALRASSAYPTLLTPIEIDGKVLVDGGIVNNFPVEEVLNMGADIVIGVDVSSTNLKSKDNLQSLPDMMDQLVSYQMITDKNRDKKNKTTLYIRPDISDYTVTSFDKYSEIIEKGMQASLVYADVLEKIALNQNPHHTPEIVKPDSQTEFVIEQIIIKGNTS
ncbi:MAG: patatin-like phospholipase family protein, partial [Bacteroidota bacterium]